MTTSSLLAWLGEASIVLGLIVALVLLVRRVARGRVSAGWIYALWLAVPAAVLASLTPAGLITLPAGIFPSPSELFGAANADLAAPGAAPADPGPPPALESGAAPMLNARLASAAVVVVWLTGIALVLAAHAHAQWRLHRTVIARARRPDAEQAAALAMAACGASLDPARDFRFTDRAASPAACGLLRPVVLLPADFLARYAPEERRVMVLHEAEHVRASHLRHRLLARLLCGIFWFHPFAWLGERSFVVDQELACDQAALARDSSIRPRTYAETLLKIARRIAERGLPRPHASASLATAKELKERTTMLERHASLGPTRAAGSLALSVVAAVSVLTGLSACVAAGAQDGGAGAAGTIAVVHADQQEDIRAQVEATLTRERRRIAYDHALAQFEQGLVAESAVDAAQRALVDAEVDLRTRNRAIAATIEDARIVQADPAAVERNIRAVVEAEVAADRQRVAYHRVLEQFDVGLVGETAVDEAQRALVDAEVDMRTRARLAEAASAGGRVAPADPATVEADLRAEIDAMEARLQNLRRRLEQVTADRPAAEASGAASED